MEKRKKTDGFFFTPLNPSGEYFDEETQDVSLAVSRNVHKTKFLKEKTGCGVLGEFVSTTRSRFAILAKVQCNCYRRSYASKLHLQSHFSERRTHST